MSLAQATAIQGMELLRYTTENEILWVPGDPGDTYTEGDQVVATVGEGVVDPAAANEGGAIGRVHKTVVCPAAATAFPLPANFDPVANSTADKCLVPIQVNVAAGAPIYLATFANHWDDVVATWTAGTVTMTADTGMAGNDYPNGSLMYVYEGPGAGEVNVIADYTHSGVSIVMHRNFNATLTTASKFIALGGEGVTNRGIGFFNRFELATASTLTCNQGSDDGDYVMFLDFRDAGKYLKNLTVPVIPARYLLLA